jgi:F0F1-type ATP synthase assembly protein I
LTKKNDVWAQVAYYSGLGFILPAAVVVGYAIGWGLDRALHTAPVLAIVLAFAGGAGGLIEVLKILGRAEKQDDERNSGNGPGGTGGV